MSRWETLGPKRRLFQQRLQGRAGRGSGGSAAGETAPAQGLWDSWAGAKDLGPETRFSIQVTPRPEPTLEYTRDRGRGLDPQPRAPGRWRKFCTGLRSVPTPTRRQRSGFSAPSGPTPSVPTATAPRGPGLQASWVRGTRAAKLRTRCSYRRPDPSVPRVRVLPPLRGVRAPRSSPNGDHAAEAEGVGRGAVLRPPTTPATRRLGQVCSSALRERPWGGGELPFCEAPQRGRFLETSASGGCAGGRRRAAGLLGRDFRGLPRFRAGISELAPESGSSLCPPARIKSVNTGFHFVLVTFQ